MIKAYFRIWNGLAGPLLFFFMVTLLSASAFSSYRSRHLQNPADKSRNVPSGNSLKGAFTQPALQSQAIHRAWLQ
jgi:hypothetical protein